MQRKRKQKAKFYSVSGNQILTFFSTRVFNRAGRISFLEKLCTVNDKILKTQMLIFSLLSKEKKKKVLEILCATGIF